jgi:hypothetical protein
MKGITMVQVTRTLYSRCKADIENKKAKIKKYQSELAALEKSLKSMKIIDRRKKK